MKENDLPLSDYCIKHSCKRCKYALLCEKKQIEEDIERYKQRKKPKKNKENE